MSKVDFLISNLLHTNQELPSGLTQESLKELESKIYRCESCGKWDLKFNESDCYYYEYDLCLSCLIDTVEG